MKIRTLLAEKSLLDVKTVSPNCSLRETAQLLHLENIGALVVTGEGSELLGIISERDLIRAIALNDTGLMDQQVSDLMTQSVITCEPNDGIYDVLHIMKSNQIRHLPVIDCGQLAGMVSMRDLTRACELLQVQANSDVLTGLPNRRHFKESLVREFDRARRNGRPLAVAMLDIDNFKQINDTHGHHAGDAVLCHLANSLVRELRTIDQVGRFGGEEFTAFLPETDLSGAKLACNRIINAIRAMETKIDEITVSVTISIGLTMADPEREDPTTALKRADVLLYQAKANGRNRIVADGEEQMRTRGAAS